MILEFSQVMCENVLSQVGEQCRRLLEAMYSMSLLSPMYVVSVKMFLKSMERAWKEIPNKIADAEKLDVFVEQLRVAMHLQVSAGLMPEHKLVWSLLLALQTTGIASITVPVIQIFPDISWRT